MVIEADVQIMKAIKLLISNDDVEGFLEDLERLFQWTKTHDDVTTGPLINAAENFPTLHRIWLEVRQQL